MTQDEWLDYAERKLADINARASDPSLGALPWMIVELYQVLKALPRTLATRHGIADQAAFEAAKIDVINRCIQYDYRISHIRRVPDLLFLLAVQLSALDEIASDIETLDATSDPNSKWLVPSDDGDVFLVPRRGPYRVSSRQGERMGIVARDLLRFHRILPTKLQGFDVRLTWRPMSAAWPTNLRFGGALFRDLDFEDGPGEDAFLVSNIKCPDQDSQISAQIASASQEGCTAIVFPELTITPDKRAVIQGLLRGSIMRGTLEAEQSYPLLVFAGSWHETTRDGHANVGVILDGHGREILRHQKLFAFWDEKMRPEKIQPGSEIHVLVTEEALISFAICLDFCDRRGNNPFAELDVDYVLVASCGNEQTMAGHIATAADLAFRARGRSFVVQQGYPPPKATERGTPLGFVLPPRAKPERTKVDQTLEYEIWNPYDAD